MKITKSKLRKIIKEVIELESLRNAIRKTVREMDFKDKESFKKYQSQHKMRPTTKVNIAGKETTVGKATSKVKPEEFDNEFEQLSQAYLDADDHMAQNDFVEDFINQYKDSDLSDEEQEMYDDLKTAYEDGDNEGMDMVLGAYDDNEDEEDNW